MIACDVGSALAIATLVTAIAAGELTYAHLLAVALIQGSFAVFFRIAEVGAVKHLVSEEELPSAIAQNTARDSAAWLAGPPLGGILFAIQRFLPFVVDVVSYVVSAVMLVSIRRPFHEEREARAWSARTHLREIGEGLRWVWRQPFLRTATLLVGGANFVSNAATFALVIVVRQRGGSAPEIGFMLSFAAAGSLLGAVAATKLHRVVAPRTIVVGYPWLGAVAAAIMAFPLPPLALGAVFGGLVFFGPTWDAVVGGHRVRIVPDALQSRVESVTGFVAIGGAALGPLIGGILVGAFGGSATFLCLAAVATVIALAGTYARSLSAIDAPRLAEEAA